MPDKKFTHVANTAPDKVLEGILASTTDGAHLVTYRSCCSGEITWIVRGLASDPALYYLECYQIVKTLSGSKFRGWGEEEFIPFSSCPLDLLSMANGGVNLDWRASIFIQKGMTDLPNDVWLYSIEGFVEIASEKRHTYAFHRNGDLRSKCGRALLVDANQVADSLLDGFGVAAGLC